MIPLALVPMVTDMEAMSKGDLTAALDDLRAIARTATDVRVRGFAELGAAAASARLEGQSAEELVARQVEHLRRLRDARLRAEARHDRCQRTGLSRDGQRQR